MKKPFLIFISVFFSIACLGQENNKHLRWMQYGIEILTEENLSVVEADLIKFRCDGKESNLWIKKLNTPIPLSKREKYLKEGISSDFRLVGGIREEMKDSIIIYSVRVENNKNFGYFFLFADTLKNNNCFFGSLTTGSKPNANILKIIELKTFTGDVNAIPLADKSAKPLVSVSDSEHELIKESSNSDTIIIGKENINKRLTEIYQQYSPGVSAMFKTYFSLPEKLGAKKIGTHADFTLYLKDTIDLKMLFNNSDFVHEMFHNLERWLSVQQSIKKTRGNYDDRVFGFFLSDTSIVYLDKLDVLPANIIHKSFPPAYRNNNVYPLYIYPSTLNSHSQAYGIYSLLGEFGANNLELEWYNDILHFYYYHHMANANFFAKYLAYSTYNFLNCLYFKHYIVHYLWVLQTSSPELYTKLMGDMNFKKAVMMRCQKLNSQISIYNSNKTKIREELANEYIPFIENEKTLTVNDLSYENEDLANSIKLNDLLNTQPDYKQIFSEIGCEPGIPITIIKE